MKRTMIAFLLAALAGTVMLSRTSSAQDPKEMLQQKVAALKQSIAENQKALRQYAWTEKTQMSMKGDVKSTKIEACRYGPDGKVQKTLLSEPAEKKQARGLKKRIVDKKTKEMTDYMDRVASLVERYVPPQPELLKADAAGGNVSLNLLGGDAVQLQFRHYVKNGDALSLTIDNAAKAIRQLKVETYLDDPSEKVTLVVDFETLPDGTNYAANKNLNVAAKQVVINIADINFQKLAK